MKKKINKRIYITAIFIVPFVLIMMYGPKLERDFQENSIKRQIAERQNEVLEIQTKYYECQALQDNRHNEAIAIRGEIKELENELYKEGNEDTMGLICELSENSPLCGDYKLLSKIKEYKNWELLLGITYAESHIGASYAPHYGCKVSNNRAGLKWEKYSDGSVSKKYNQQYADLPSEIQGSLNGCFLYYFETPLDFFEALNNTIQLGYIDKGADTPEKMVKYYVGKYSQDWIDNVSKFINK